MAELTNENYHSTEMRQKYMGYSQFCDFLACERKALARVKGEIEDESTDAFSFGGYVDAYFSHELNDFIPQHPEMFNSKTGELKSQFKHIENVIKTIEEDEVLMKYLNGEHQVIMTGEIAGVPFKIKIDAYHPGKLIVDQKIVRSMEPIWVEETAENGQKYNVKKSFWRAWHYEFEGCIYREIVRQNTGLTLPFVLAVTTKENVPDKGLYRIPDEVLDEALEVVKKLAPRFDAIKKGEIEPESCGQCDVCRKLKKLTGVFDARILDPDYDKDNY